MENFVNEFNMWMQTVQSELQEKSMRSTIIICAATLDAQLEKLIKIYYYKKRIQMVIFLREEMQYSQHSVQKLPLHTIWD